MKQKAANASAVRRSTSAWVRLCAAAGAMMMRPFLTTGWVASRTRARARVVDLLRETSSRPLTLLGVTEQPRREKSSHVGIYAELTWNVHIAS